jgi:hypothetical protein
VSRFTREQRHWRGVRRGVYSFVGFLGFFLLRLLADHLDWWPLRLGATVGAAACIGYGFWLQADVFSAWFIKGKDG